MIPKLQQIPLAIKKPLFRFFFVLLMLQQELSCQSLSKSSRKIRQSIHRQVLYSTLISIVLLSLRTSIIFFLFFRSDSIFKYCWLARYFGVAFHESHSSKTYYFQLLLFVILRPIFHISTKPPNIPFFHHLLSRVRRTQFEMVGRAFLFRIEGQSAQMTACNRCQCH